MPIRAEGLTHKEVLQRLSDHIRARGHGGQKVCADEMGVSQGYLNDVLKGRTRIGPKILESLGLVETVVYERVR